MFSFLCMHFFIAYQARIAERNSGAIDVNQRFLVSEFLLILCEEHPFIPFNLFITYDFTALY